MIPLITKCHCVLNGHFYLVTVHARSLPSSASSLPPDQHMAPALASHYSLSPVCPVLPQDSSCQGNREVRIPQNRLAPILWVQRVETCGLSTRKPGEALKKIGYFLISPQSHNMQACLSKAFSASWVPGGPIEPRTAEGVYSCTKQGGGWGKRGLYGLFFTLVWVRNGSCTPTLCV